MEAGGGYSAVAEAEASSRETQDLLPDSIRPDGMWLLGEKFRKMSDDLLSCGSEPGSGLSPLNTGLCQTHGDQSADRVQLRRK